MVYVLKIVIFHGELLNNKMVYTSCNRRWLGYLWAFSRHSMGWKMVLQEIVMPLRKKISPTHSPDVWYISQNTTNQKRRKRKIFVFWRCISWKWLIKGRCCLMVNGQGQKHRQPEWLKWVNSYPRASVTDTSYSTLYYSRAYIISDEWWYLLISYCIHFAPRIRSDPISGPFAEVGPWVA